MLRLIVGEPNPPARARSAGKRKTKNRSKRRKTTMKRRARNRKGRFVKGHGRVKGRKRGRRAAARAPKKRKARSRSRARTSNPPAPKRRRRRSSARRSNPPARRRRTRHVYHARRRRRNPPLTVGKVVMIIGTVGAGIAGAKLMPMAIIKLAKKPEWNMGWKPVALAGGSTIFIALVGYGIGRALTSKRQAFMIGVELLAGGAIATAHEGYKVWKAAPAPAPQPKPAGQSGFSPDQIRDARSAAALLNRGGQGYFSPAQYAGATTGGALMTGGFTAEKNF